MPAQSERLQPKPISLAKLLIVEGKETLVFFSELLEHLNLAEAVDIRNFGGIDELPNFLETLVITPGFAQVVSVGIIRDAEKNAHSAFQSVKDSVRRANLNVPKKPILPTTGEPRVSVFILPDCESRGMLETLCLRSVETDKVISCIDTFFQCVEKTVGLPANMDKARLHAFLASRSRPHLSFQDATRAGYWPWDHPVFDPIKQFLTAL